MAGAVITIDDVAVINALAHVIAMAGDTRAVTANIGEHIRTTTIDRIKKQQSKISNRRKIKRAGWNNAFLASMIAQI